MTARERAVLLAVAEGVESILYTLSGGVSDEMAARGLRAVADRIAAARWTPENQTETRPGK